jgi:hypothetical protein
MLAWSTEIPTLGWGCPGAGDIGAARGRQGQPGRPGAELRPGECAAGPGRCGSRGWGGERGGRGAGGAARPLFPGSRPPPPGLLPCGPLSTPALAVLAQLPLHPSQILWGSGSRGLPTELSSLRTRSELRPD